MPDVDTRPVLCLNSLITAGEPIEVSVTHTWFYTDQNAAADHRVADARVSIYANGSLVGADYIPREGDAIRIVAESAVYGEAHAEVVVPFSVPAEAVKWTATNVSEWSNDEPGWMLADIRFDLKVEFSLQDPAQTVDYYHFSSQPFFPEEENPGDDLWTEGYRTVSFSGGTFRTDIEPIFSEHVNELDAISGNDSSGFTFFTDRQFSGKTYALSLQYDGMDYFVRHEGYDEKLLDCGLDLTLSSVSESYYDLANYKWHTEDGILGDLGEVGLGDPLWGYSNVSTGAGVVAARSSSTYRLSLADFLRSYVPRSSE